MNFTKLDIITTQHGRFVLARGEHRQVKNCRTCMHVSRAMWESPCIGCSQARNVDELTDKWESPINDDVEEETMRYGGKPSKEYTETVIMQHMKEIRDIARKYCGRVTYLTCNILDSGFVHAYNSAVYDKSGDPVINVMCDADEAERDFNEI